MSDHIYSDEFYTYIGGGSRRSAGVVVPMVRAQIRAQSVLDVGGGNGAWCAAWQESGIADLCMVDGEYVDPSRLLVPREMFHAHDLGQPLDLGRRFDIVQSLEVAEHLPESAAEQFVDLLATHGDVILFSAAVPAQGGEHHVNEQPPEYWRRKFAARGYACFDWLRPLLADRRDVEPWYRFNTLIYANAVGENRMSADVAKARIPDRDQAPMCGDLAWNARRAMVALLPQKAASMIARTKAALAAAAAERQKA